MRIPVWFVMVWVVIFGITAVLAALFTHRFVRDRTLEADELLSLPRPARPLHLVEYFFDLLNPPKEAGTDTQVILPTRTAEPTPTPAPATVEATDATSETPAASSTAEPAEVTAEPPTPIAETTAEATVEATEAVSAVPVAEAPPAWSDPRRVSVLLLGIDQRQGEQGPFPTDTMILFSIDPVGKTAAILSIPRDLWVDYPTGGTGRINAANIIGDERSYPGGGGPAMAVDTVEQTLGVKINFYVLINFEVFTAVIEAVGPVEVCPERAIHDDKYPDGSYGTITVDFPAGCQELDAERLLQYARTRHDDENGDIGRSARQQEVILAVREKVLSTGGILALLPEAARLWESLQANFRTNMTFEDMVSLARAAESIPEENIRRAQISFGEVYQSVTPDGEEILVPILSDISLLIEDLYRPAGAPSTRETAAE